MTPDSPSDKKSLFRNPVLYSCLVLFAAALYAGYIVLSRYQSNRDFERQKAHKAAEQRLEEDRRAIEQLGGSDLAIRALYVSPAVIRRGESAQLCYDVANAKAVSLDPPEGAVWPSHSRCIALSPKKTTNYTLTISGASGATASQSVTLQVR